MSTDPFSTLSQVRLSEPPCYLFPIITTAECLCSQVLCFPTPVLRHWCAPRFQGQEEVVSGTWSQFLPRRGVTACPPSLHSLLYFYPHWACFASLLRFTGEKHRHCTKMKNQESVWALPRPLVVHREHKQAGADRPCAGRGTKSTAPGERWRWRSWDSVH